MLKISIHKVKVMIPALWYNEKNFNFDGPIKHNEIDSFFLRKKKKPDFL